jgi:hypothetical protein
MSPHAHHELANDRLALKAVRAGQVVVVAERPPCRRNRKTTTRLLDETCVVF